MLKPAEYKYVYHFHTQCINFFEFWMLSSIYIAELKDLLCSHILCLKHFFSFVASFTPSYFILYFSILYFSSTHNSYFHFENLRYSAAQWQRNSCFYARQFRLLALYARSLEIISCLVVEIVCDMKRKSYLPFELSKQYELRALNNLEI